MNLTKSKVARLIIFIITLCLFLGCQKRIDEMEFEFSYGGKPDDQISFILAKGLITKSTPEKFRKFLRSVCGGENCVALRNIDTIALQSNGGDLLAGMELGREIRINKFNTVISTLDPLYMYDDKNINPKQAGKCISACAYAFFGGISRRLGIRDAALDGQLGIHQYYKGNALVVESAEAKQINNLYKNDSSKSQYYSALILDYLKEMSVSADLFSRASKVNSKEVVYLSFADAIAVNALTIDVDEFKSFAGKGLFYFTIVSDSSIGLIEASISCNEKRDFGKFIRLKVVLDAKKIFGVEGDEFLFQSQRIKLNEFGGWLLQVGYESYVTLDASLYPGFARYRGPLNYDEVESIFLDVEYQMLDWKNITKRSNGVISFTPDGGYIDTFPTKPKQIKVFLPDDWGKALANLGADNISCERKGRAVVPNMGKTSSTKKREAKFETGWSFLDMENQKIKIDHLKDKHTEKINEYLSGLSESKIHFKEGSVELSASMLSNIKNLSEFLKKKPYLNMKLLGRSSMIPNIYQSEYTALSLSIERNSEIIKALSLNEIEENRIFSVPHGNKMPINVKIKNEHLKENNSVYVSVF